MWLAEPAHADRVTAELATALRGALTVLRDSDVQAVVGEAITRRANAMEVGPGLGAMLEKVVTDGGHRKVVDLVCARAHDWLVEHGDSVMNAVQGGAPGWTPRFVDKRVGERVYKELLRFVTEMRDMPEHPARGSIDTFLTDFAADLQNDADTRARVERLKSEILGRGEVQDVIASVWSSVRTMILSAAEDERSELRLRARASLMSLGARLAGDGRLQGSWTAGGGRGGARGDETRGARVADQRRARAGGRLVRTSGPMAVAVRTGRPERGCAAGVCVPRPWPPRWCRARRRRAAAVPARMCRVRRRSRPLTGPGVRRAPGTRTGPGGRRPRGRTPPCPQPEPALVRDAFATLQATLGETCTPGAGDCALLPRPGHPGTHRTGRVDAGGQQGARPLREAARRRAPFTRCAAPLCGPSA
ncbi:hypothetical protein SCALM49S_03455 [Streptomyces californicus]